MRPDDFYDVLWKREYHLRHAFRFVGPILAGKTEALCQMRLPDADELALFKLPPGLIDSCFQCLASTAFEEFGGTTYIPLGIDGLYYFGRPENFDTEPLWCHAEKMRHACTYVCRSEA